MNGEFNSKFEELFRDFSEEPSSNCWDAISQKLDTVLPIDGSASASQGASGFSKFITTTIGKSVAIFTGVAIVGVATFALLNTSETPTNTTQKTTLQISKDNKIDNKETALVEPEATSISEQRDIKPEITQTQPVINENVGTHQTAEKGKENQLINEPLVTNFTAQKEKQSQPVVSIKNPQLIEEPNKESEESIVETTENPVVASNTSIEKPTNNLNLIFPNVITPNGDGFNDLFVVKNIETISNSRLVIINSNGIKVFEANNYQNNWDASNAPDGTYFYVFETKIEGKSQTVYGTMQILR